MNIQLEREKLKSAFKIINELLDELILQNARAALYLMEGRVTFVWTPKQATVPINESAFPISEQSSKKEDPSI
jgi:hypothetical protein